MNEIKPNIDVWLIEDDATFRRSLSRAVNRSTGMTCVHDFGSYELAAPQFDCTDAPDVILLDVGLPGVDGIAALAEIRKKAPNAKVVILTAFDDDDKIFRAVCMGASGYLLKTSNIGDIEAAIGQASQGGAPMTPSVARRVLELLSLQGSRRVASSDPALTDRERDVLELMAQGLIKKEIAVQLNVSIHTVSTHLRNIYDKLHVNTNTAAVAKAIRKGIV